MLLDTFGIFLQQSWRFEVDDTFGTLCCLLLFGWTWMSLSCSVGVYVCILSHTTGWNPDSICSYHLSALTVAATFEPIFGFLFAGQLCDMQIELYGISSARIRMLVGGTLMFTVCCQLSCWRNLISVSNGSLYLLGSRSCFYFMSDLISLLSLCICNLLYCEWLGIVAEYLSARYLSFFYSAGLVHLRSTLISWDNLDIMVWIAFILIQPCAFEKILFGSWIPWCSHMGYFYSFNIMHLGSILFNLRHQFILLRPLLIIAAH